MDQKLKEYLLSVSLPSGTRIRNVQITDVIGVGQHGIVYEAQDTVTQQVIALKEFFPIRYASRNRESKLMPLTADMRQELNRQKTMFMDKGLRISRINHPNVVRLSRIIEANNTVYLVMTKIDGALMSTLLGPTNFIPPETKKAWASQLIDAVGRIHAEDLLHLAIEPSNIIINEKLGPVLIDFGYTETEENSSQPGATAYHALEVINGNASNIDKSSDIYSLGATLYHLISGNEPILATSRAISKSDPQPKITTAVKDRSAYGISLLESIDQATAIRPEHRYSSTAQWVDDLSESNDIRRKFARNARYLVVGLIMAGTVGWIGFGKDYFFERSLWQKIVTNEDPCAANDYAEKFPNGRYKEGSNVRIALCEERTLAQNKLEQKQKLKRTKKIVGDSIEITPGCFVMGSGANEMGHNANERKHEVCIENRYQLTTTEVSVGQFKQFVNDTNYKTDAERNINEQGCWTLDPAEIEEPWSYKSWASWRNPYEGMKIDDSHPVACVSPNDINTFLTWLNNIAGTHYRLATEAEWEFAARGRGEPKVWPWGDYSNAACTYANVADLTNIPSLTLNQGNDSPWPSSYSCTDNHVFTAPVGSYKPSFSGFHDLVGNVWEITCSAYSGSYAGLERECADMTDEPSLTDKGGSWESSPLSSRSASRDQVGFYDRGANIGFRLALTMED